MNQHKQPIDSLSSARDVNFKYVHVAWILAVHAGMTGFESVYNDESPLVESSAFN
ncbi:MAG: hypothetical protein WCP01_02370 [Methylococcaceae bacterium]